MKKILPIFLIIIIFLVCINIYNNDPKIIISRMNNNVNALDDTLLRYKINLAGVIPVGEAVLKVNKREVYRGQSVYHLTAYVQSLNIFSKVFYSSVILSSYIDMQQFNPLLFRQKLVVKGQKDIEKEVTYDQSRGIMFMGGVKRQILPNTQDPLSALFNVRRLDFNEAREFEMNINTNQKNYILKGTANLKDITIKKKIYKTVILKSEIKRRDKNPYHKSTITMVLLEERNNIPILINAFAGGIPINARLIDVH